MKNKKKTTRGITRRDALKYSGMALGGLAIGGTMVIGDAVNTQANEHCTCPGAPTCDWTDKPNRAERYSYFDKLKPFYPFDKNTNTTICPLGENEMRITFMGSTIPMNMRKTQQMMSVFVEVGWDKYKQMPLDQFIFDCGSGVCTNYSAMNVATGRMNKIFINHLHADHMSDLTHIYCFGPSQDRKSPLYVFGPKNSGVKSPAWGSNPEDKEYDDGTKAFCENLRRALRWHTESFSFQTTSYPGYPSQEEIMDNWGLPCMPEPVDDDPWGDSYSLIPIELDWEKYGESPDDNVAYYNEYNDYYHTTSVKITHFPVIHARKGSVGYKLEWKTPGGETLSMVYTSDTKPEYHSVEQAKGVDVFIHEMIVPAQVWTMKCGHMDSLPELGTWGVRFLQMVQNSSHSPQGAFGYMLSLIEPRPRLTVATHFPVANDTVACAMRSIKEHCNVYQGKALPKDGENPARITWSFDLMVIKVTKDEIVELRGEINDYEFGANLNLPEGRPNPAKYSNPDGTGDPYAQIDTTMEIPSCENGQCNYREDGY